MVMCRLALYFSFSLQNNLKFVLVLGLDIKWSQILWLFLVHAFLGDEIITLQNLWHSFRNCTHWLASSLHMLARLSLSRLNAPGKFILFQRWKGMDAISFPLKWRSLLIKWRYMYILKYKRELKELFLAHISSTCTFPKILCGRSININTWK